MAKLHHQLLRGESLSQHIAHDGEDRKLGFRDHRTPSANPLRATMYGGLIFSAAVAIVDSPRSILSQE
jgi:hypothetical protein